MSAMKENIQRHMLNILLDTKTPVNSKTMAQTLGISEKTTLKYLNFLKQDVADYGATIDIKQGQGSILIIQDASLFARYLNSSKDNDYLNDPKQRNIYILSRLLLESDYLNVYDLSDELAISPSLLRSCLKTVSGILAQFDIDLIHSHLYGYKVKGDENDVRRCLMKECRTQVDIHQLLNQEHLNVDVKVIESIVSNTLKDYDIAITNDGMRSLTLHIMLCIYRCETENVIKDAETIEPYLRSSTEYFVINAINRKIKATFGIDLPVNELMYLTMHLAGKQRKMRHERIMVKVGNDALVFYNKLLRNIYKYSHIDLFDDDELRTSLLNHIVPFLTRYENNNQIEKSELMDIRNQYPMAYDLASSGLYHLTIDKGQAAVSEAETGYFALHIALALEKRKLNAAPINVAVIGIEEEINNLYSLMTYKLNENFEGAINTISFFPVETVTQEQVQNCRLILNTTSMILPFNHVAKISPYLSMADIDAIRQCIRLFQTNDHFDDVFIPVLFDHLEGHDPQSLLEDFVAKLSDHVALPHDFVDELMKREVFMSTSYDTQIAVPHPLENPNHLNFIAVGRTDEPIKWGENHVRLIFLTCIYGNHEFSVNFFKKIAILSQNRKIVSKVLDHYNDFDGFIKAMHSIETWADNG